MRVIQQLDSSELQPTQRVVCVGAFDGVHRGHQAVLSTAAAVAKDYGAEYTVLTFEPVPVEVFGPRNSHNIRLSLKQEREQQLSRLGVDTVVVASFDDYLRQTSAYDFANQCLRERLGAQVVVVSENHTWGADGEADIAAIKQLGADLGFAVQVVPLVTYRNQPISSSQIRQLLWAGQVAPAAQLLGRAYTVSGTVQPGKGRGRQLGFPTANLLVPEAKLVPSPGVYTGLVQGQRLGPPPVSNSNHVGWPAAISVGGSPTLATATDRRQVEVHLLDFEGDLVDAPITVNFMERLRDQHAFNTKAALKTQIAADITELRLRLKWPDEMQTPAPADR